MDQEEGGEMMEAVYDLGFFKDELSLIQSDKIRELTTQALKDAPAYIWYIESSVTGKYHPPADNLPGGLCRHLKKTAWMGYRMFFNLSYNTDIGTSAGLTHDICQRGEDDTPSDDIEMYKQHGELAEGRLRRISGNLADAFAATEPETPERKAVVQMANTWSVICDCVLSHMGRWGNKQPQNDMEIIFHCADVAASTRGMEAIQFLSMYDEVVLMTIEEIVGKRMYFITDAEGDLVFNFGKKHLGHKLKVVALNDSSYLRWMLRQGEQSADNKDGFPADVLVIVKKAYVEEANRRADEVADALGAYR